jgi:hypothetical protein
LALVRPSLSQSPLSMLLFAAVLSVAAIFVLAKILRFSVDHKRLRSWQQKEAERQRQEEEERLRANPAGRAPVGLKWAATFGDISNSYFAQDFSILPAYSLLEQSLPCYLPRERTREPATKS